jgi:uncharacterized protein
MVMTSDIQMKSIGVRKLGRLWLFCLMVLVTILLLPGTAYASYPTRTDTYVNDYAGILDAASEGTIRDMFRNLMDDSGVEAVVVTISSVHDYQTSDDTIDSFATHLFNQWGIGSSQENNGILILVAATDRDCRIELGAGYGTKYDSAMQQVIDEHMIPYFKTGDYQTGIIEGSRNAIEQATGEPSGSSSRSSPSWPIWVGIVAVLVGIAVISSLVRRLYRAVFHSGRRDASIPYPTSDSTTETYYPTTQPYTRTRIVRVSSGGGSSSRGGGRSSGGGAHGHW